MNSSALATYTQETDDGAVLPAASEAESRAYCLYFLVCAAESGPLDGLIKIGIADCFPTRYRQHTATWGAFDLSRSALLRVRNRREAEKLELALRYHFGDPVAESIAKAAGKTLTSEDFIAMGSWRRYPGRRDNGFTEFYALVCLTKVLAHVEDWRMASAERRAGTRLQRGISPAECSTRVRTADPSLTRAQRCGLRERRRAAALQAAETMRAASNRLLVHAFGSAMAYQELMVHVDLRSWRAARAARDSAQGRDGLVRIYFRPMEFMLGAKYRHLDTWLEAQAALRESFAASRALADSLNLTGSGRRGSRSGYKEGIYRVQSEDCSSICDLPYPIRSELMCARLGSIYSDPFNPMFELYESLEKAVESRQPWSQEDFRL